MTTNNFSENKNFILYISIFLIILNILMSLLLISKNTSISGLKEQLYEYDIKLKYISLKNEHYARMIGWLQQSNQIHVSPNQKLMKENGDSIVLSNLVGVKPKLVFKYSELNCNICVDAQLVFLKKFIENFGEENLIMISSYKFNNNIFRFKVLNKIENEIFNIDFMNSSLDNLNAPYYFILDNTFTPKMMFIPEKTFPEDTEAYFKKIQNMYFKLK